MFNTVNRRAMALFLALILAFVGIFPIEVSASGMQDVRTYGSNEEYSWIEKEDGTLEITYYNGTGGNIKIPSTILGKRVISIGNGAFYSCSNLVSVEISEGVTDIGDNAFSYCKSLMNVKIPGSVMSIGKLAFAGCKNLASAEILGNTTIIEDGVFAGCSSLTNMKIAKGNYILENGILYDKEKTKAVLCLGGIAGEIQILEGVENIGNYAFSGCSLTSVKIPRSVTNIGEDAFSYCNGLMSVEIPENMTSVGASAFSGCSGLTMVEIPESVTSISEFTFYGCSSLKGVIIPETVTSIGGSAFSGCSSLENVEIREGVTSIGSFAFYGCSGLTRIEIPPSVTSIGSSAFNGCSGLTIYCFKGSYAEQYARENSFATRDISNASEENPTEGAGNGNIGNGNSGNGNTDNNSDYKYSSLKWGNAIEITGYTGQKTELVIPSEIDGKTVTSIGSSAFRDCSKLTRIEIPTGVTSIGEYAFYGCSGLTRIEIPSGVTSIGDYVFYGCSGLTSMEIPSEVTSIGRSAFNGCSGLTRIEIPSGVTRIGDYAFSLCSGLISMEIPSRVTSIGNAVFEGCSGLTSMEIPTGVTSIGVSAFGLCSSLTSMEIPTGVTSIGASAFESCSGLTRIEIPSSVKNIGNYAFYGCSGLTRIEIPTGVTSIENSTFRDCSGLTRIEIPTGVTSIGESAFRGCSSLTSIEIPTGVTRIDDYTFYGCSGLTSMEIPTRVTRIGDYAFSLCSRLTSMEIPTGVTRIGDYVFYGCSGLTNMEIPTGVTSIGRSAFYGCSRLTSMEIPTGVTSIDGYAFYGCSGLTRIEVPSSVTSIGADAFRGCSSLTIYCSKGSYAEQYAKENNFAIQDISGTADQNPTEKPESGDTEEPGKEPSEKPGTETPGTSEQKPTEKPGSSSTVKPTVSPDGKTIQTITTEDIVKTMGDQPFYIDAETDGDGILTYESKTPGIVKVDGTGRVTIVSAGTAKITVTASATATYSSAKKTVTVTVIPEGYTPIEDIDDLYAIRNNPEGNYILVNDIDMSATRKGGDYDCGAGWDSIEKFWGTLDGNGHRIVGMHIFGEFTGDAYIGLFETSGGSASIKNLAMVDCDINIVAVGERFNPYLGIISGNGGGMDIESCYSSGKIAIQGNSTYCSGYVGGLIGVSGTFKNCFSTCEIDCENDYTDGFCNIGGIAGYTTSVVRCYNVGSIKGNGNSSIGSICGGFGYSGLGSGYGNLCYLKGTAARGIGKYNSSDASDSPNCVSLTEAQMKNPKLFTGFDFTDTWEVDPYCSYPYPQLKNNRMIRINGIRLDPAPTKLTYNQGESLKLDGAVLEISYEDGINTSIPIEKNMLSGYDMNKIGQQTVTVSYGGEETSFDIEVREVQVSGISIPKTLSLDRSKQKQLTASITPANASDKSVTWKSDNPSVASVSSSGLVKAKARGTAVITATAANGIQASCTVTVLVPAVSVRLSQSALSMVAGSQRSIKAQLLPLESTDSVSWKSSNKAVAEVYDGSILAKKEGTAKITAYTKSGAQASCTVTVKKAGNGSSSEIKKITSKKAKIKSAKNVKKKSVKLKLNGSANGSGYKIQYGTSRKFKGAKTVTAKGNTATIKKLKAKKTYYIRVRIYKKISGKTYYGKWSSVKSVKIKK